MVNTLRNGETAIMNWIDIDKQTKGYHFKDLNQEQKKMRFVPVSESREPPETNAKDEINDAKTTIIANTIFDLVNIRYPRTVSESEKTPTPPMGGDEGDNTNLYKSQTWAEFEEHAKIILTFLNITNDKETKAALEKLRQMFKELGDGNESKGLQLFNRLDEYIKECKGDRTQPKLQAKILLANWTAKEIRQLFQLFKTVRNSESSLLRGLSNVKDNKTSLRKLIADSYGNELNLDENIITKLTRFRLKKETSMGQGEILFALLFKDCVIGEVGDVDCFAGGAPGKEEKIPIELKANSAGPDDIGRVKVEEMMAACGYEQKKTKENLNAFSPEDKFKVTWDRKEDNNPEGGRKHRADAKVPTIDLKTLAPKWQMSAIKKLRTVWGSYIDKAKHGNEKAYVVYIRPGSDSAQIAGWMDNLLIIIQTVDDIIKMFNEGLLTIRAQSIQGNEYMTFKLEVAKNKYAGD